MSEAITLLISVWIQSLQVLVVVLDVVYNALFVYLPLRAAFKLAAEVVTEPNPRLYKKGEMA